MARQLPPLTFVLNKLNILVLNDTDFLESEYAHEQMQSLAESLTEAHFIFYVLPVFGTEIPLKAYRRLYSSLVDGSLEGPAIEVLESSELAGRLASYNAKKEMIEVSEILLSDALDGDEGCWKLLSALVEEYGHYIDEVLRNKYSTIGGDALHDEGAILAYDLIRMDFKNTDSLVFADVNTDRYSGPLSVDFDDIHSSLNQWLSRPEQLKDDKEGEREFFGDGMNKHEEDEHSFGHKSIELVLREAGYSREDRENIYFGNWLRDYSQLVDPAIVRKAEDVLKKDYSKAAEDSYQELQKSIADPNQQQSTAEALERLEQSINESHPEQGVKFQTDKVRALLDPRDEVIANAMLDKIDRFAANPSQKKVVMGKVLDSFSSYLEVKEPESRKAIIEAMKSVEEATDQVFVQQDLELRVKQAHEHLIQGGKALDPKFKDMVKRIKSKLTPFINDAEARKHWDEFSPELISLEDASDTEVFIQLDESILISRAAITKAVDIMALKEFGSQSHFRVTEDILGVYRPEEHIDNPLPEGDPASWGDPSILDPDFVPPPTTGSEVDTYLVENAQVKTAYSFDFNAASTVMRLDDGLVKVLSESGGKLIILEGHTDNIGSESVNQQLSLQRAEAVKQQLLQRLGDRYTEASILVKGRGEKQPIAPNTTEEGRAKNRRVEVSFLQQSQVDINPTTGLKNYIASPTAGQSFPTAAQYMSEQLQLAVDKGRTTEGMRHFGQALHVLEDYFAHSNFVEVSFIKLGHKYNIESFKNVLPWVEPTEAEKIALQGRIPIVTGRFGRLDVLASVGPKIADALFPLDLDELEFKEVGERSPAQKAALAILEDLAVAQRQHGKENGQSWLVMYEEYLDLQDSIHAYTKDVSDTKTFIIHHTLKRAMVLGNIIWHYIISTLAFNVDDVQTLTDDIGTNPTHSQLAKDHNTHHFHSIAATLAQKAVLKVGIEMDRAWGKHTDNANPVETALSFIVHPDSTDWMDDDLKQWGIENPSAITRAATDSWVSEVHDHIHDFKEMAGHVSEATMKSYLATYKLLVELLEDEEKHDK